MDTGYIGIGQISVKIHGYRPKYRHIAAKIPVIGQISVKMKISVSVSVADMLVQIYRYRQRYRLEEYICITLPYTRHLHTATYSILPEDRIEAPLIYKEEIV